MVQRDFTGLTWVIMGFNGLKWVIAGFHVFFSVKMGFKLGLPWVTMG